MARLGQSSWYRIESKASATTKVYIYDEIGWFGVTASDFVRELNEIDASQIELHINSPGGSVFDGLAIYQSLKDHKAKVLTRIDGLAASAASFIAMAGEEVEIARNAMMMIHNGQGMTFGDADMHEEIAKILRKHNDNIADIYMQKAGGALSDWLAAMKAETWYNADEAVEAGLADRVGGSEDSDTENKLSSSTGTTKTPVPSTEAPSTSPVAEGSKVVEGTGSQTTEADLAAIRAALSSMKVR